VVGHERQVPVTTKRLSTWIGTAAPSLCAVVRPPLISLQSGRPSTPRIPSSLQPHGVHPHDGKLRGLPQCD